MALKTPCLPFKILALICTEHLPVLPSAHLRQAGTFTKSFTEHHNRQEERGTQNRKSIRMIMTPGKCPTVVIPLAQEAQSCLRRVSGFLSLLPPLLSLNPSLPPKHVSYYRLTQDSTPGDSFFLVPVKQKPTYLGCSGRQQPGDGQRTRNENHEPKNALGLPVLGCEFHLWRTTDASYR